MVRNVWGRHEEAGWMEGCVCVCAQDEQNRVATRYRRERERERGRERVVDSFGSTFSQVQSTLTQKEQKDASLPQLLTVHHTTKHPHPTLIHK